MSAPSSFAEAVSTLRANPLRASLAALAMAAAVATTAIVVTALNGLATSAQQTTARAFGTDTFLIAKVFAAGLNRRALAAKLERNPDVTRADLRFLERNANGVVYAAIAQQQANVVSGGRTFESALVSGVSAALADVRDIAMARGRFFSRDEEQRAAPAVVVGAAVADALYPSGDPIGARLRIGGRGFTVVGVQARQGTAGGVSLDRYVWIPYPTFERMFGAPASLQIFARGSAAPAAAAEDRARASMRARRRLAPGVPDNFDLLAPEASRGFVASLTERVGAAGPPISVMALLAAIVVVANTALASVTARTREIGIRRAIGATRRQILMEVLTESLLVALGGGAAGLAAAWAVLGAAAPAVGVPLSLEPSTAAFSLSAAAASGLAAGWYPARRAAASDVIAALRSE